MTEPRFDWHLRLATLSLLALMIGLPLATIEVGSRGLFKIATVINLLFVLAMLPKMRDRVRAWSPALLTRLLLLTVPGLLLCWQQIQGPMWDVDRLWWYLSLPLLFAGLVAWFGSTGDRGFRWLVLAKLPLLVIGIAWVCGAALLANWGYGEPQRFGPAPMFRHIRNLNDEMPWAIALGILLLNGSKQFERALLLLGLTAFGYFTLWSGSRGQLLSMGLLVLILGAARAVPWLQPVLWQGLAAVVIGMTLALVLGQGDTFLAIFGRSIGESGIGFTSGRDLIWSSAIEAASRSSWTLFTGLGPDAYARLALGASFQHLTGPTIQPHNSLLLWWLEFGLVGALAMVLLLGRALAMTAGRLHPSGEIDVVNVVAALVIAQSAFSMVTGIAYHVMPMSFMLILIAYLAAHRLGRSA